MKLNEIIEKYRTEILIEDKCVMIYSEDLSNRKGIPISSALYPSITDTGEIIVAQQMQDDYCPQVYPEPEYEVDRIESKTMTCYYLNNNREQKRDEEKKLNQKNP